MYLSSVSANIEFWLENPLTLRSITEGRDCKFNFSRELFKNALTVDRDQSKAEIQKNIFSNTSEHLFLILQSICGKMKLALNQQ